MTTLARMLVLIGIFVMAGCTTVKPCVPEIQWKEKIVTVYEKCPCLTEQIPMPDLWLLKLDIKNTDDEKLAQAIKHDNGELIKYITQYRIACACKKEEPK